MTETPNSLESFDGKFASLFECRELKNSQSLLITKPLQIIRDFSGFSLDIFEKRNTMNKLQTRTNINDVHPFEEI